jgi:hypothetical protein
MDPALLPDLAGLGVLAGDTLRGAADLGLPMIGVTMLTLRIAAHLMIPPKLAPELPSGGFCVSRWHTQCQRSLSEP